MRTVLAFVLVVAVATAGCSGRYTGPRPTPPAGGPTGEPALALEMFVSGLVQPLAMVDAGDGRFLVAQQDGKIVVVEDGRALERPFLDLSAAVSRGSEQGLLGIALDPDYATNGRIYVDYTDRNGDTHVARVQRSADLDLADPATLRDLLTIDQPYANHNGGHVVFGPDRMLYIGLGDGGAGGDPQNHAQDTNDLLGKILRLDVSGDEAKAPADNPFADGGGRAEVFAYGLRNPWRFNFDARNGDLYIADVGQNSVEEVDYAAPANQPGANYGWNEYEGSKKYRGGAAPGAVFPVYEYPTSDGCAVTGGYVYRGSDVPELAGVYLFSDYCNGIIHGLWGKDGAWTHRELLETGRHVSSFAQDAAGELYVLDLDGAVLKVVRAQGRQ